MLHNQNTRHVPEILVQRKWVYVPKGNCLIIVSNCLPITISEQPKMRRRRRRRWWRLVWSPQINSSGLQFSHNIPLGFSKFSDGWWWSGRLSYRKAKLHFIVLVVGRLVGLFQCPSGWTAAGVRCCNIHSVLFSVCGWNVAGIYHNINELFYWLNPFLALYRIILSVSNGPVLWFMVGFFLLVVCCRWFKG